MTQIFFTKEEAINMLPDKEDIHVFTNPSGMVVGCDWSKKQVCDLILSTQEKKDIQFGGEMSQKLKHGLAVFKNKWYFIESTYEVADE